MADPQVDEQRGSHVLLGRRLTEVVERAVQQGLEPAQEPEQEVAQELVRIL